MTKVVQAQYWKRTGGLLTPKEERKIPFSVVDELLYSKIVGRHVCLYNKYALAVIHNPGSEFYVPKREDFDDLVNTVEGNMDKLRSSNPADIIKPGTDEFHLTLKESDRKSFDINFLSRGVFLHLADTTMFVILNGSSTCAFSNKGDTDLIGVRLCRLLNNDEYFLPDGSFVDDYQGNDRKNYKCVKIGNRIWMAENLNETRTYDGQIIPLANETFTTALGPLRDPASISGAYSTIINEGAVSQIGQTGSYQDLADKPQLSKLIARVNVQDIDRVKTEITLKRGMWNTYYKTTHDDTLGESLRIIIPDGIPVGERVMICRKGSGLVSIDVAGVTLNGLGGITLPYLLSQFNNYTILCDAPNEFVIY